MGERAGHAVSEKDKQLVSAVKELQARGLPGSDELVNLLDYLHTLGIELAAINTTNTNATAIPNTTGETPTHINRSRSSSSSSNNISNSPLGVQCAATNATTTGAGSTHVNSSSTSGNSSKLLSTTQRTATDRRGLNNGSVDVGSNAIAGTTMHAHPYPNCGNVGSKESAPLEGLECAGLQECEQKVGDTQRNYQRPLQSLQQQQQQCIQQQPQEQQQHLIHQQYHHLHAEAQRPNQSATPEQPEQLSSSHSDSPVAVANMSRGMHAPAPILHLDLPSPPLSAATQKSRRELHRRATASTMEHCSDQHLSPVEQQQQHQQHWHGSASGNTTPTSRGGAHNLYAYRSPQSPASIPRVDSDASGSIFGPDSVRSLGDGFGGNDVSGTTTPTNADEALHTNWWQLQTDMEGVTIGGSSWTGVDMDVSFLEGAGDGPGGSSGNHADVGAGEDGKDTSGMLGVGLGLAKLQAVPEGGDNWGAEAPAALKQDFVGHQVMGMEHQLAGTNPGSFYDGSHFMPGVERLPSLGDAVLNDASWHIPELQESSHHALPHQHADMAFNGGRITGQGSFNERRIILPQASEGEGGMIENLLENEDTVVEGEDPQAGAAMEGRRGGVWVHSAARPLSALFKKRTPDCRAAR